MIFKYLQKKRGCQKDLKRDWFFSKVQKEESVLLNIPAENECNPISADGYMYIDCLWVAGSIKGHGYSSDLLNACIEDSKNKGKKGLCILATAKKKPFLAAPKFLKYKGLQKKKQYNSKQFTCRVKKKGICNFKRRMEQSIILTCQRSRKF